MQDVTRRELTMPQKRRSKYNARKTTVDGIVFDSAKEAKRYQLLMFCGLSGGVRNLEFQPFWVVEVAGVKICTYRADYRYESLVGLNGDEWRDTIEDHHG